MTKDKRFSMPSMVENKVVFHAMTEDEGGVHDVPEDNGTKDKGLQCQDKG